MKKTFGRLSKLIGCVVTFLLIISNNCQGRNLKNIDSLLGLNFNQGPVRITAPYSILEDAKYTPSLSVFEFGHYTIKIVDKENFEKFILEIRKPPKVPLRNKNVINVQDRLPWWSKSAPKELKSLDFSSVDGKLDEYKIGEDYQLKLLGKQGHWGKVYALERSKIGGKPKTICAVKLLLTRSDREMSNAVFHQRHFDEIRNNFIISDNNIDLSVEPYGVLKKSEDHYLILLEYGENAHEVLDMQSKNLSIDALYDFVIKVNKLHAKGYSHGDLKIDNMLFVNNKIKLCDWYSLCDFKEVELKKYRYIGDNLPPEAMRALYFEDNNNLLYSIVNIKGKRQFYVLHPVSADRYCLGISLLEFIAPDLYKNYDKLMGKGFNPWKPDSLDFWKRHADYIKETQAELLGSASKTDNEKLSKLYMQIYQFISLDPMERKLILTEVKSKI